jgi:type III secretory pathway component EscV
MLTVRKEFCKEMSNLGIAQNDPRFFEYIVTDMNRNDQLLVEQYEEMEEIKQQLEEVIVHPVEDYLSYQEMKTSMDWLIHRHFYEKHDLLLPKYISYDRMTSYIQEAASHVVRTLAEKDSPLQLW